MCGNIGTKGFLLSTLRGTLCTCHFYNLECMFKVCFLCITDFQSISSFLFSLVLISAWSSTLGGSPTYHTIWAPFNNHFLLSREFRWPWNHFLLFSQSVFWSVDQFIWWQNSDCFSYWILFSMAFLKVSLCLVPVGQFESLLYIVLHLH